MEAANRAKLIGSLLDETKEIEQKARAMQEARPSSVDGEFIRSFREGYQTWYGSALELLPDDLRAAFSKEFEGGRFLPGINAFVAAPTKPNAVFAKAASESPETFGSVYFQHPVETSFESRFIKQQALLRQAQQRYIQLSTIPASPVSGIISWGPTSTSGPQPSSERSPAFHPPTQVKPVVFIAHGRSLVYLEVYRFLKDELELDPVCFETEDHTSEQLSEILSQFLRQASAAVVVMTGEDQTIDNKRLARQNVVHEAGLFQAKLGFENVVLLKEVGVEQFSNAQGIIYIPLDPANAEASFYALRRFFAKKGLTSK